MGLSAFNRAREKQAREKLEKERVEKQAKQEDDDIESFDQKETKRGRKPKTD